jgi:putative methyltransferase (TIGR04325 family)
MTPMAHETLNIWEGIYRTFEEAGGSTDVFSEPLWVERSTKKARQLKSATQSACFTPQGTGTTAYVLPAVAALLQAKKGLIRLLDFGGSVGFTFPSIVSALARPNDVDVHVVDNESICEAGRDVFKDDPRIHFQSRPPDGVTFDIVHCGSSIQYVSDWTRKVRELVASGPEYLVFDDVPAGDIATFVSLQNYYGKKIPHWFFNVREFVEGVEQATDYRLCYKARYVGTFLGNLGTFPMDNFPLDHRIENAYNLVFVRGTNTSG